MRCESCEKIVQELALEEENYKMTTIQKWHPLIHRDLLNYADYNNGVSEGGGGYGCQTCFTFFEDHYHIAMEENEVCVFEKKDLTENDIQNFAHYLVIAEEAEAKKASLQEKESVKVYARSDVDVLYTFSHQTDKEHSYLLLEMQQKYGFNHPTYSNFPHISLSFEELIADFGSNDNYAKKAFILTFDAKAEDIRIFPSSSPYTDSSVTIAFTNYIEPKDLYIVNPETTEEVPLTDVSIDACKQRDDEAYLEVIRALQTQFKEETKSTIEKRIKEKVQLVKSNLNTD